MRVIHLPLGICFYFCEGSGMKFLYVQYAISFRSQVHVFKSVCFKFSRAFAIYCGMSELDIVELAINKPRRYQRLTSAQREAAEERMMTYLAKSDDEEEAFLDSGDEYTPEDDGW